MWQRRRIHGEQGPRSDIPAAPAASHGGRCGSGRIRLMTGSIDLAAIWAFIIAFAVFVYVVMEDSISGLGILFRCFPKKPDRDVIMNSVPPVWDGNETWLVSAAAGMMPRFRLAYAGADAGALTRDDRDADRPDLSRCRLRISLADR